MCGVVWQDLKTRDSGVSTVLAGNGVDDENTYDLIGPDYIMDPINGVSASTERQQRRRGGRGKGNSWGKGPPGPGAQPAQRTWVHPVLDDPRRHRGTSHYNEAFLRVAASMPKSRWHAYIWHRPEVWGWVADGCRQAGGHLSNRSRARPASPWCGGGQARGRKSPALTVRRAKVLIRAALPRPRRTLHSALELVKYQQHHSCEVYCSHRKRSFRPALAQRAPDRRCQAAG